MEKIQTYRFQIFMNILSPYIEPQILYDAIKSIILLCQQPSHSSVNVKCATVREHEFSRNAQKLMTFKESRPGCVLKMTPSLLHSFPTKEKVHEVEQATMLPVKTVLEALT